MQLADNHISKPDVCLSAGDASANAYHQLKADGLEDRPQLCRYHRRQVVANATGRQTYNGDVVAAYLPQGVQAPVVVGRVALEVVVLFVEYILGSC
jgi:hypothetical protein